MSVSPRRPLAAVLGILGLVLLGLASPASAAPPQQAAPAQPTVSQQAAAPQQVTSPAAQSQVSLGYYVVPGSYLGTFTTPYTIIAQVSSAGGEQTLTISQTQSVAKSATLTTGVSVADVSAQLGYGRTDTSSVTVSCSTPVDPGRSATYTAYPRSEVTEYHVYERILGSDNDRYVGTGQFNQPVGFHCQLDYL